MSTIVATVTDLRKIYTSSKDDAGLQIFVDMGNLVVNEQLVGKTCTQSDARLTLISSWLAAHFAEIAANSDAGQSGPLKSQKIGEASETYASPTDAMAGFMTTRYGQTAVVLDICGLLAGASTNSSLRAKFEVVGNPKVTPVGWAPGTYPNSFGNGEQVD